MLSFGPVALVAPWMLLGLMALPVIWWLLRITPPSPRRVPFPPVRLLFGLRGDEEMPAKLPGGFCLWPASTVTDLRACAPVPRLPFPRTRRLGWCRSMNPAAQDAENAS